MRPINPWWLLGGTLTYNYACHRLGWPTICSKGREYIPPVVMVAGWCALTEWLIPHYVNGEFPKINLDHLEGL